MKTHTASPHPPVTIVRTCLFVLLWVCSGATSAQGLTQVAISNPPATAMTGTTLTLSDTVWNNTIAAAPAATVSFSLVPASGADLALPGTRAIASGLPGGTVSTGSSAHTIPLGTAAGVYAVRATLTGGSTVTSVGRVTVSPMTTVSLTVRVVGTGSGTVVSNPPGINTSGTQSAPFQIGTRVTLTATRGANSAFSRWTRGLSSGEGSGNQVTITLNGNRTIDAEFVPGFRITVAVNTNNTSGRGSVTGGTDTAVASGHPEVADLRTTTFFEITPGTAINLAAAVLSANTNPPLPSTFTGWNLPGGGISPALLLRVTPNGDSRFTANFGPPPPSPVIPDPPRLPDPLRPPGF